MGIQRNPKRMKPGVSKEDKRIKRKIRPMLDTHLYSPGSRWFRERFMTPNAHTERAREVQQMKEEIGKGIKRHADDVREARSSKYDERVYPAQGKDNESLPAAKFHDYVRYSQHYRSKIKELFSLFGIGIAKQKFKMLERAHTTSTRFAKFSFLEGDIYNPTAGIPQRFETLSRVLTQLTKNNPLAGEEAVVTDGPFASLKRPISPHIQTSHLLSIAHSSTDWSSRTYNCRVFVNPTYYVPSSGPIDVWGRIRENRNAIIGIQVFDPDPKKLVEVAKAMTKRRPNDPIPILDLYGNVFFP